MQSEQNTPTDLLIFETEIVRATTGKRFANYIIDLIGFVLVLFVLGILIALVSPSTMDIIDSEPPGFGLLDRLISLVLYALYMSFVEGIFKGKSLGKLITGTRAVNLDGSKISFSTAFSRGFSRAVPFCALSAFGTPCNPWQDKWTNTLVADEKQLQAYFKIKGE